MSTLIGSPLPSFPSIGSLPFDALFGSDVIDSIRYIGLGAGFLVVAIAVANILPGLISVLSNCKRNDCQGGINAAFSSKCLPGRYSGEAEFRFFRAGTSCEAMVKSFLMHVFNIMTCNTFAACKTVVDLNLFLDDAIFYGEEAEFGGDSFSYCAEVLCLNMILNRILCGMWSCCGCAERRENVWLDQRIRWKTRVPAEWVFFSARSGCLIRYLTKLLDLATLKLFTPYFRFCLIRNMLESSPEAVFGGHRVKFTGTVCEYYSGVFFPNQFFTIITLGVWHVFGFASRREGRWLDGHITSLNGGLPRSSYAPPGSVTRTVTTVTTAQYAVVPQPHQPVLSQFPVIAQAAPIAVAATASASQEKPL